MPPERPRPRVLLVEFFSRGGLMHYSLQLARALAAELPSGAEVVLLTSPGLEASPPPGVRVLPELGVWNPHRRPRLLPRRLVRAWRGLVYVHAWRQLLRVARRERPALLLLPDLEHRCDAWFVRRLRRQLRRQQPAGVLADLWHNVEAFDRYRRRGLVRKMHWRIRMARSFDAVFVNGQALAQQFLQLTGCRACAIVHGNQDWLWEQAGPDPGLDARLGLPAHRPLALLCGSLSPYKGVEVLLAAMAAIAPARRPLLLIAGMATAAAQLSQWRHQAHAWGLDKDLRWDVGYIPTPEMAWYARRADWVVLPYRAASQSGIAHLALTAGKPLLVTATGSLPELIDGNGIVVPPGDSVALADALVRLAESPQLRRQWGERSLELANTRHLWSAAARAILAATLPERVVADAGIATKALPSAAAPSGITRQES